MALTSQTPGRPSQLTRNVFLLDMLTAQLTPITVFEDVVSATNYISALPWYHALSPDSSRIAIWSFVRSVNGTVPVLQTYRVADGFQLNTVFMNGTLTGFTQGGNGVDWHPAQNLLVYAVDRDIPAYDFYSGALIDFAEGTALSIGSPDQTGTGQQLTFPRAVYQYTFNRTIRTGEADYAPAFSPNGQQVAYVRATYVQDTASPNLRQPSVLALRIVNTDGSNDHEVLPLSQGVYVTHLSWSRSGTQLVFDAGSQLFVSGFPANGADLATDALWIVNTDGNGLHTLRGASAGFPVWSPMGMTFCNLPGVVVPGGVAGSGSIDDCGASLNLKANRTPSGQFRLDITGGTSNLLFRILASTNLTSWQSVGTMPRTNSTTSFVDTSGSNLPRRFYRVVLGNN